MTISTFRDIDFLITLRTKIRTASFEQAQVCLGMARERLEFLQRLGIIDCYELYAVKPRATYWRPWERSGQKPVAVWRPGNPFPDFNHMEYVVQNRWRRYDIEPVDCVSVSRRSTDRSSPGL
jgi:hypothetical protein